MYVRSPRDGVECDVDGLSYLIPVLDDILAVAVAAAPGRGRLSGARCRRALEEVLSFPLHVRC